MVSRWPEWRNTRTGRLNVRLQERKTGVGIRGARQGQGETALPIDKKAGIGLIVSEWSGERGILALKAYLLLRPFIASRALKSLPEGDAWAGLNAGLAGTNRLPVVRGKAGPMENAVMASGFVR